MRDEAGVRSAFQRLALAPNGRIATISRQAAGATALNAGVLVETMAPPAIEALISVTTDAVVPALVIGLGGIHVEALDKVAIVPLPA